MMKPEFSKPFDLAAARAGAPYSCTNGRRAEMLRFYASKMVGIHDGAGAEPYAGEWLLDGTYCTPGHAGALDLIMLPLGLIDGKPVFVGDEVLAAPRGEEPELTSAFVGMTFPDGHAWKWPALTKAYPTTNMTFDELAIAHNAQLDSKPNEFARSVRAIANAALRHAIGSEQVILPGEVLEVARRLSKSQREAREMAIAKAVATSLVDKVAKYSTGCSSYINGEVDLAAIIATIK